MMELKPCPFCGHSATLSDFERRYFLKKPEVFYYIECFGCGVRTELCVDAIIAVAKWNRRAERPHCHESEKVEALTHRDCYPACGVIMDEEV